MQGTLCFKYVRAKAHLKPLLQLAELRLDLFGRLARALRLLQVVDLRARVVELGAQLVALALSPALGRGNEDCNEE